MNLTRQTPASDRRHKCTYASRFTPTYTYCNCDANPSYYCLRSPVIPVFQQRTLYTNPYIVLMMLTRYIFASDRLGSHWSSHYRVTASSRARLRSVFVCMFVRTYVCIHTYVEFFLYVRTHVYARIYIYIFMLSFLM